MDIEAFKKDLIELMEKHGVTGMGAEMEGDIYGAWNQFIVTDSERKDHVIYSQDGYIDQSDLRE
jgi:hypothetical protein